MFEEVVSRLKTLVSSAGLPVKLPHLDVPEIIQALQHDKKKSDGRVRFILLKGMGEAFIYDQIEPGITGWIITGAE